LALRYHPTINCIPLAFMESHMQHRFFILLSLICICCTTFVAAQSEKDIVAEARKLYKIEMASWHGTAMFMGKFPKKQATSRGYFSYVDGKRITCLFFSNDSIPKTVVTMSFDTTYNDQMAKVDTVQRSLTENENSLLAIRQEAWDRIQSDSTFQFYNGLIPNIVPLADAKGKRAYIFTAPSMDSIVVFGNDYLLIFDAGNKIQDIKRIHKNVTPIEYGKKRNGDLITSTTHMHFPETGEMLTPTDICTVMLYEKTAGWQEHIAISRNAVSIWNCQKDKLTNMPLIAWQKLSRDKSSKPVRDTPTKSGNATGRKK